MSWNSYRLSYRILTPLHIGYRRLGTVQCTRYYVPGRTLWGAIAASLTRACYTTPGAADYLAVADYVADHLLASYFYPSLSGAGPYYPALEQGRWRFGDLPASQFEARFIGSLGSTALSAFTWAAEEGSLHEIEFILSEARVDPPSRRPVYLQGYLYLDQDRSTAPEPIGGMNDEAVLAVLRRLTVGGELRYGLGHIEMEGVPAGPEVECEQAPRPLDVAGGTLRAHLRTRGAEHMVRGPAEPLVGREWANGRRGTERWGAGQDLSEPIVGWAPGGHFDGDPALLRVGRFGIWQCAPMPTGGSA